MKRRDPCECEPAGKKGFSRRRLFAAATAATTGALAYRFGMTSIAHAIARTTTRRFIFAYFPGGWDQILFLDPRDQTADGGRYRDDNRSTSLVEPGYAQLQDYNSFTPQLVRLSDNMSLGPAAEKTTRMTPFRRREIFSKMAIVRGLNMATVSHEVGYRYFLTGKFPAGNAARGTSVATELAAQMQAATPLPTLSLRVEAYNDRRPGNFSAVRVDSIDDLLMVLNRGVELLERDGVEQALAEYSATEQPCSVGVFDRRGLLTRMRDANGTAESLLTRGLAAQFQFVSDPSGATDAIRMRNAAIRARYGFASGDSNAPGARAALAAIAIKEQVAQCVSVNIGNGTDTHFTGNRGHADLLYPGIQALAALLEDLAVSDAPPALGGKWLDHTTVVAFSEFARTPLFNQFGGRDHHIASSCLLAGAGIAGDQVLGSSGETGVGVTRYDFRNRRVAPDGENIQPEHIAATLMACAGLDPSITRVEPLHALIAAS